ncbi:OLC1v1028133C1 [Oldenlandia corymbosa var. corymbosa]|uniref:OLC1v1028133C1 n=1 Tax=Oldenlandia corymbosa var. corymbosa TaxID=529605 RepID=A0AAV1CB23_OLDCO|nr:OLC1v1028133C1 [Oldenlandia corymbosa var. corymbosa]
MNYTLKFIIAWIIYPALLALFLTILIFTGYYFILGIKLGFDKLFLIVCERWHLRGGGHGRGRMSPIFPEPADVNLQNKDEEVAVKVLDIPAPEEYKRDRNKSITSCAICLDDLMDGELCQTLPQCKHTFHSLCINPWVLQMQTCPICRQSLPVV